MIVVITKMRSGADSPDTGPLAPPGVPVHVLRPVLVDSYQVTRRYSGTIVARRKTDLGFELPGKVIQVLFDVGEQVEEGEVLAVLDAKHLTTKREMLVARKQQAQSVLDELVAGPRQEAIRIAEAEVRRLSAQKELLEVQFARREKLLLERAVSRDEYDVTRYTLESRTAEHAAAKQRLKELTNGTRVEQISAQQAALRQLSAQIASADVDLEKCVLRAPFSGRIAARSVDEGKVVQAGSVVFRILESDALEAWIGVPPTEARQLELGGVLPIVVDGNDLQSRVSRILPTVDRSTYTQTVVLDVLELTSQTITDGQLVRLQLKTRIAEEGIWLPTTALEKSSRGLWSCYVLEDTDDQETFRVARRYVELLYSDGARVFVRGTITEADQIVSDGTHRTVPGQLVRVGEEV